MVDKQSESKRKMIGNYRLLKVLSDEGGFGTVWLGHDAAKDRLVCIKILKQMDEIYEKSFNNEVAVA